MNSTEETLKERIKELTCLYEVSSIIVNVDAKQLPETLLAIAKSLKKGFQFPNHTEITINSPGNTIKTGNSNELLSITSNIYAFNKKKGEIIASLNNGKGSFLKEEQQLLDNVALKIGNLLERIEIFQNEISLKRQMERADRLSIIGELTAGIAHELNTPLANILGFAELLKDNLKFSNQSAEDLDKIIQNAIFSREVVKKLMFFACEMPQEMKEVNIVPRIKNAITLLDASFKKAEVKYIVKIEDEELLLRADTIQLTQIIFNLIINAIYFSPKNSLVTIEAFQTNSHIVLKISDQGSGLSDEALLKVFQPFFTTKPTGDGSGLGLSVVHGIVSSHNGIITAENNPEKGATFTVKLPKY
ncbi:HAMP domain-containing histidine kinase [Aureisphaera sp. CAU 1614]|uniref:histidine kinase n=1 Tax=Halomarinibacterium sedimenti TaxID=2857106 RepID=A0A9X1FNZ2_9FLAO|nr:HAMP domain-containing sensor histidine kinase [Halomarinibacterium sedimenti]MBW2938034.1 HAMP domain-containing histidine kinase [Halomarinibacterium sedimenti]